MDIIFLDLCYSFTFTKCLFCLLIDISRCLLATAFNSVPNKKAFLAGNLCYVKVMEPSSGPIKVLLVLKSGQKEAKK